MASLTTLLQDQLILRENSRSVPKLQRFNEVLDMSKTCAISSTSCPVSDMLCWSLEDHHGWALEKLEKQEAKPKVKIEKRARRDLYEGSKLLEQTRKQVQLHSSLIDDDMCLNQSCEEMFMKVRYILASPSVALNHGLP